MVCSVKFVDIYRHISGSSCVGEESKSLIAKEMLYENSKLIIERDEDRFIFENKKVPKLPLQQTSIYLLKETERIMPIYDGFSSIMRREFFGNALEEQAKNISITPKMLEEFKITVGRPRETKFSIKII